MAVRPLRALLGARSLSDAALFSDGRGARSVSAVGEQAILAAIRYQGRHFVPAVSPSHAFSDADWTIVTYPRGQRPK